MLEIGGRPRCHLVDPIGDVEARDTIVRKPIGICGVVDGCPMVGAREGAKEGGTP